MTKSDKRSETILKKMKKRYEGVEYENNAGHRFVVIEYRSRLDVLVRFINTGEIVETRIQSILNGHVKDRMERSVYGVGYLGIGCNGKNHRSYNVWKNMIARCYNKETQRKHKSYIGCSVCDEWHNFQNFSEWYDKNIDESFVNPEIDKDIKIPGNKVYSPCSCLIVSKSENLNELSERRRKEAVLISPFGQVFKFRSQTEASWVIGCSTTSVWEVVSGRKGSVYGWRAFNEVE